MQERAARCIGIDWGTSRFRAYLLSGAGEILERHVSDAGVASVGGEFGSVLVREIGGWLDAFPAANVIASGMVGSRQGWIETHYVPCPVDLATLAAQLQRRDLGARCIAFTPGLTRMGSDGVPDVMRGEEVQVLGALGQVGDGYCVLPGSHSKWVLLEQGRIVWFASFMSGELFDVLVRHTLLTRGAEGDTAALGAPFARGLDYAKSTDPESGGFLKRLFSTRSLVARSELSRPEAREYLSGLMIGCEIEEAFASLHRRAPEQVTLLGTPELIGRYRMAFERRGIRAVEGDADAAAAGHFSLARQAGLV
jgi:2-dehydro-3-deoxygalactonokinase